MDGTSARTARPRTSILDLAGRLAHELPGLLTDRVELLKLELQRAGNSLVTMVVLGLTAGLLLLTAWFTLWIGIAGGLMALGLHWGWTWAMTARRRSACWTSCLPTASSPMPKGA